MKYFKQCLVVVLILCASIVMSCAKKNDVVDLSFMVNVDAEHPTTKVFRSIIIRFQEEYPNISITLTPQTGSYENLMKAKMAADDLPDLWTTHGWSVHRYSEYLRPLNDQPWFALIDPQIKPVITNQQNEVFVLPMNRDVAGIAYSQTVFDEVGIDATGIKTWNDLLGIMQKIKDHGITPVHIGGKDLWTIGGFFDWAAPSVLITDETNNERTQLLNGEFNTEKWTTLSKLFKRMKDKGFFNKDVFSASFNDSAEALATKTAAVAFYGNYVISQAKELNPNIQYGFFPVPAYYEGDTPTLISGERIAVGVYKDTPNEEASLQFLNYLARPENIKAIAEADATPTGLTHAIADLGELTPYFETYSTTRVFPYFDRAYLPSGMWDTMCNTGAALLVGTMTPQETAEKMKTDFLKLYK